MKFISKLFIILSISIFAFSMVPQNTSFAGKISSMVKGTEPTDNAIMGSAMTDIVKSILSLLQVGSALITIIVLAFTGFNYIVAADAEMKSEMKKKMLPIIIGLILVFSATSIAKFLLAVVGADSN